MKTKSILSGGSFGPLSPYINHYLTEVKEQGYAVGSIGEQVCALKLFDRWLKRTGREVRDLNEAVTYDFLGRVNRGYPKMLHPQLCGGSWRCFGGLGPRPLLNRRDRVHPST